MGLRDNFNQAFRELLTGGGQSSSGPKEKDKSESDLDSYLEARRAATVQSKADYDGENANDASKSEFPAEPGGRLGRPNLFGGPAQSDKAADRPAPSEWNEYFKETDPLKQPIEQQEEEMTVISKSTVIVGDIRSLANITINGKVRGDVDVLRDATVHGVLVGDLQCSNSKMDGSAVQGNVFTKGNAYIFNDSMLLGDLKAQFSSIDGKVKGNMDIGGKINLHQNAIVAGNINTGTITVEEGANIKGYVNTSFLDEQGDSAFPKQVEIDGQDIGG